jgi:F420-non-reducing hydrogenase iron-sulfur subunit
LGGVSRLQYSPDIRIIRLMCTGRVDLAFVLQALRDGADGVLVGGCYLGECHYVTDGNYDALSMMQLCKKLIEHIGVSPDRLAFEQLSAADGVGFSEVMNDFSARVKALGPLGGGEGVDDHELREKLDEVIGLVPYIKIVMRDKLAIRLKKQEDYEGLFSSEEIDVMLDEVVSYHIDPEACRACMICYRQCPVEAIEGGRNQIHVIDQDACIRCGTCFEVCPPRFAAVRKLCGEPVPPPLPLEERAIVRMSRSS